MDRRPKGRCSRHSLAPLAGRAPPTLASVGLRWTKCFGPKHLVMLCAAAGKGSGISPHSTCSTCARNCATQSAHGGANGVCHLRCLSIGACYNPQDRAIAQGLVLLNDVRSILGLRASKARNLLGNAAGVQGVRWGGDSAATDSATTGTGVPGCFAAAAVQ